jgi:HAD superfamily hydrolase (TIGR01549 family)
MPLISSIKEQPTLLIDMMNTVLMPKLDRISLYQHLLRKLGINASTKDIKLAFTRERSFVEDPLLSGNNANLPEREKWAIINSNLIKSLNPRYVGNVMQSGIWLYEQLISNPDFYEFPATMRAFLSALKEKQFKVVAATNHESSALWSLLHYFSLENFFDALAISDVIGYAKPDPRFFQEAMLLSETEPSMTAFMGNNPINDMKGAHKAGISLCFL